MSTNLYDKIYKYLFGFILQNGNTLNYRMPSERMLALKFNTSRRPVQYAYKKLIKQGYVYKIHGKGYFIKDFFAPSELSSTKFPSATKILFVTPTIKTTFMQQIIAGISQFCNDHHIELSINISENSITKETQILQSVATNFDGVILFPLDNEYYNEALLKLSISKFPLTIVDRSLQNLHIPFVTTDGFKAMTDAVQFLYEKNFKEFVFITPPQTTASTVIERINGFNHGLFKFYGAVQQKNLLLISGDQQEQISTIVDFLKKYPQTEVIISMGPQINNIIFAVSQLGLSIPENFRLMAFDSEFTPSETKAYKPYIIEQDSKKMGYVAAELLYNQIYGDFQVTTKKLSTKIIDCSDKNDYPPPPNTPLADSVPSPRIESVPRKNKLIR